MSRLEVALLFGGRSGEHEVSLRSAQSVAAALAKLHDVKPILIDRKGRWWLQDGGGPAAEGGTPVFLVPTPDDAGRLRRLDDASYVTRPHVYFPVLHGPFGEDGTVQGLLELAGVPYVGSGVAASAAGMDKALMKALFASAGLPQVPFRVLHGREGVDAALDGLEWPVFVKPANLGSSVGITRVTSREQLPRALDEAFAFDTKVLLEQGLAVREVEVSVIGNERPEASVPGEIVPDRDFYDYASKYSAESRTELLIPAPLTAEQNEEIRRLAVQAYRAIDACGFARMDFFVEKATGRVLVNEINTIPGFTSISMFPKLWEATGLAYAELVDRLVQLGLERHRERSRLRTEP